MPCAATRPCRGRRSRRRRHGRRTRCPPGKLKGNFPVYEGGGRQNRSVTPRRAPCARTGPCAAVPRPPDFPGLPRGMDWMQICGDFISFMLPARNGSQCCRWRPYRVECTGSLPTSEVKRRRARLVLGWGTAREDLRVLPALFAFLAVRADTVLCDCKAIPLYMRVSRVARRAGARGLAAAARVGGGGDIAGGHRAVRLQAAAWRRRRHALLGGSHGGGGMADNVLNGVRLFFQFAGTRGSTF